MRAYTHLLRWALTPYPLMLELLALALASLVFLFKRGINANGPLAGVLGSGGHTGELLAILSKLTPEPILFIYGEGDTLSVDKAKQINWQASYAALPRARKVHQSFFTSIFSSIATAYAAALVLFRYKPHMILCNGPGTSLVVVLVARMMLLNTKVIYIESFARVKSLSLTGKLMYHFRLADRFLVQWPELADNFPTTEYTGPLV